MIERFLDKHELSLTDEDVGALTDLFEMTDNELLDILLERKDLEPELNTPAMSRVIQMIRES